MVAVRRCADDVRVDHPSEPAPAVQCRDCGFAWNSPAMAEGLRLLGSCPKCGGALAFAAGEAAPEAAGSPIMDARAPHLVLGVPRR
jgi:hypothetical protein